MEYDLDEITPAEEVEMKTRQYKEVVEKKERNEKESVQMIKSLLLTGNNQK